MKVKDMHRPENYLAYWLGFADGNDIGAVPPSPNIVPIAFGVTDTDSTIGTAFLTSKHSLEDIRAGARKLQERGQRVVLSINGATETQKGWSSLDPENFAENAYDLIVRQWEWDGIDLDNEDPGPPPPNFPHVIRALRRRFGRKALITLPVYMGKERDAYLKDVRDDIDGVSTMAYWEDYEGQIALYEQYASLVGGDKVAIGVSNPGSGSSSTPTSAVARLAAYDPPGGKFGMMFWNINSPLNQPQAFEWCEIITSHLPRRHTPS